jgi:hypothetical protein
VNNLSLLAARFKGVLAEAQKQRPQRDELTTGPDGAPEMAWAAYERGVMHQEINDFRAKSEHSPIPLILVEQADRQAAGHSDYSTKFAWYCAELALNVPMSRP